VPVSDEENPDAPERNQPVLEGPEVPHDTIGEGPLSRRRNPPGAQKVGTSRDPGGVENHVRFETTLPVRRLDQEPEGPLGPQRMTGVVAARHTGAPDREDAVTRPDSLRQERRLRDRLQHALDHFLPREQRIVRRHPTAEHFAESRGDVHPERAEEMGAPPPRERVADVLSLEHGHLVAELGEPEGGREPDGPGADDGDAAERAQPFRVIVLQAWTQWASVPPPRIAAATFTASAISSGLTPASEQAEAYESMQ
jgi:hypothetical protein